MAEKLYNLEGVEIFAEGTWNNDPYSKEDLEEILKAFNENKKTIQPYVKLGHDEDQELLQRDGYPAAGWIGNLYIKGKKLVADLIDIPEKIFKLIENKAYKKVSSEIYWDIDINGKSYKRMLAGIALLGSDLPAVTSLNDILAMYGLKDCGLLKKYSAQDQKIQTINYTKGVEQMAEEKKIEEKTDKEIEMEQLLQKALALETRIKELESKVEAYEVQEEETKKELSELENLKKYKEEAEQKILEAKKAQEKAELEKKIDSLDIPVSAREFAYELLNEDKKEYSLNDKKYSKVELFAEILKLHSAGAVNLDESSELGKGENQKADEVVNKKLKEYADKNKISYSEAYRKTNGGLEL